MSSSEKDGPNRSSSESAVPAFSSWFDRWDECGSGPKVLEREDNAEVVVVELLLDEPGELVGAALYVFTDGGNWICLNTETSSASYLAARRSLVFSGLSVENLFT